MDNNLEEKVYKPQGKYESKLQVLTLEDDEDVQKDSLYLYLTASTVGLTMFALGIGMTWTSPVLPKLEQPNNTLGKPITQLEGSWIATFLCIGGLVAPLIIGNMADIVGRKNSLILMSSPMLFAFLILAFAKHVYFFYFARFLHGISLGGLLATLPMYMGEVSENHNRGKFNCILGVFMTMGVLYPLVVGPILSIQYFTLSCTVPVITFLICFSLFMPETPPHLVSKKKTLEAERVLMKLRNKSKDGVSKELQSLCKTVENESSDKAGLRELFGNQYLRKTFVITGTLLTLQQFTGMPAVMSYLESIFRATGSSIRPDLCAIIIGLIQVVMNILTTSIVDKFGRKTLLTTSCLGCGTSLLLLGLYYYLKKHGFEVSFLWWMPVSCLVAYVSMFHIGIGPIPWAITSEIFPSNIKSVASALSSFTSSFFGALVTLAYPLFSDYFGMAVSFWVFGVCCVLEIIFVYFVLPETKGKTADDIQKILRGK